MLLLLRARSMACIRTNGAHNVAPNQMAPGHKRAGLLRLTGSHKVSDGDGASLVLVGFGFRFEASRTAEGFANLALGDFIGESLHRIRQREGAEIAIESIAQ